MDGEDLVLVALINNPRDLEIVRAERWYRIPAKHAPAHVTQARYVVFYLTKPFGEYKWTIREYAASARARACSTARPISRSSHSSTR